MPSRFVLSQRRRILIDRNGQPEFDLGCPFAPKCKPFAVLHGVRLQKSPVGKNDEDEVAILALQSTLLRWMTPVDAATGKQILDAIQQRAKNRWKQKWMVELVKAYVKIAIANGDENATPVNRRSQLERAFKSGSCNLDTAIALAAAVDCRFQLACTQVEIEEF